MFKPTKKVRVIDCLTLAGVNVDCWNGKANNIAYSCDWSFHDEARNISVFNIWAHEMGAHSTQLNLRKVQESLPASSRRHNRARDMDQRLCKANQSGGIVRVIVIDGTWDNGNQKVKMRELHPQTFRVTSYDEVTGQATIEA